MPRRTPVLASVQLFVFHCLLASQGLSQVTSTQSLSLERKEGIHVNAFAVAHAKPLRLRILFNVKAEEASPEKAVERLIGQMNVVTKELEKLSAIKSSIDFSDIQSGQTPATTGLLQMASAAVAQFQPGLPGQPINVQPRPAPPQNEPYQIPKIFVATTIASADWDIHEKSKAEITALKFSTIRKIEDAKLNGKHLTHAYSEDEEDEIFERARVDVRNPALLAQWNQGAANVEQALKSMFICEINEEDFNTAMKDAFKIADKYAKQIAVASELTLGVIDSINIHVVPTYTGSNVPFQPYSPYPVSGYYPNGNPYGLNTWEPPIKPYEIRLDNLGQLSQKVDVFVRYKIK